MISIGLLNFVQYVLLFFVGIGIGEIAANNQQFMDILAYGGIGFICYMGFKIATAPTELKEHDGKNPGFIHGVLFQWVNPKAWTACLGGIGAFNLAGNLNGLSLYILISTIIVFLSVSIWAYAGSKITGFLATQRNHRMFNIGMGASPFCRRGS